MYKTLKLPILVTTLMCLLANFSHASFELGMSYYEKKYFENAYKEFFEAAQYGDRDAQNNVGAMYYRGEFLQKNIIAAYAWMALAAQPTNGNTETKTESGTHTKIYARLSEGDKKLADSYYEKLISEFGDTAINQKLTPVFTGTSTSLKQQRAIKITPPTYPQAMLSRGKTGFVDVIYTIDKHGITRDHVIAHASSKEFAQASIKALRTFQFEPTTINNIAVDVNGFKRRFTFEMSNVQYNKKKLDKLVAKKRAAAETGTSKDKLGFAYFLEAIPSFVNDYQLTDNPNQWYEQAANQGSGAASYFLGRNILYGDMCTQDNSQSMGWLLKAAKNGVTDAQYMLAIESFSGARFEKNQDKAFFWLARAATLSQIAKLRYAWILATHPDSNYRNKKLASEQLSGVDANHIDKQSFYQTQAAVAAENGNFTQAIKWQKEALEDAQDLQLPVQILEQQLASYSAQKPWREEI
jgi:uncharacterized protein